MSYEEYRRKTATGFVSAYNGLKVSQTKFATQAGVARISLKKALDGASVSADVARKLCTALGKPAHTLFKIEETTLSDETILHYHRFIRVVLGDAKRKRLIPFNVAAEHITPPKSPRREAKYYDDAQARQFREALDRESDIRKKASLMLTLFTGVRKGELCGLSWPDIDFDNCTVSISKASQYQCGNGIVEAPTKTASSNRMLNIPPYVAEVLREYRAWWVEHRFMWGQEWQGEQERLFIQDNGKPINPDTINNWLNEVLKRDDLPHITLHSLRHTFATLAISSGIDIRTVQSLTGHAQASTLVNIYSHAIRSSQEKAAAVIADILLPGSATG